MAKNLKKAALAAGSVFALSASLLVAPAATAAAGDVTIRPTAGTGTTAFATDDFELSTSVRTAAVNAENLAYRIENPDQNQLYIKLTGAGTVALFDATGYKEDGTAVTTGLGNDISSDDIIVDFVDLDIVSLVISDISVNGGNTANGATGNVISVALDEGTVTNTALSGPDGLEYGELTAATSVSVRSWVEASASANYATVDTDFASDVVTVNYVDPSSVSLISRIERFAGATVNNRITTATTTVRAVATTNLADIVTTGSLVAAGQTLGGVVLVAGDRVLLSAQTTTAENGIYTVGAADTSPTVVTTDVAGTDLVLVLEGTGRGARYTGNGTDTISASNGSNATESSLNAGDNNSLGASIDFSNPAVNLAQVDLSKWELSVVSSSTDDLAYGVATIAQVATPAGYTAVDGLGRLFAQVPVADLNLNDGETYSLKFRHLGDTVAPVIEFTSPGYQVVQAPTSTATQIKAEPTTSTDASVGTFANSVYPVAVRNGVATVTYKSQIMTGGAAVETANVPVLAVVTAGSAFPTGATLTVSGATETIKAAGATMLVTGLTDSKGNWSVSVTSSDTSSAGSAYTIQFWVLDEATPDAWVTTDGTNNAIYRADYAGASLAATGGFTADSTVLSGDNVTVTFSVKDQFGQPLSAAGTRAYSVELKAPVKTNLEQFVAVTGGKASFTFKNYLKAGESDIITGRLFTGTSTSPTYVAGATVSITLYNTNAVAAVNVPAEVTSVTVTYDDFITGLASATNVAPTDGNNNGSGEDFVYNGTVVDANGAGVPGASVTISGKGFQFVKNGGDTYFVDSITLAATEAGTFSVRGWTTVASATGNKITVTSAGKTASTLVKSALPTNPSTKNLQLSWNLPATVVMNTTYAITATLTDKWGNPITGAAVDFEGYGAAQFNGAATASRVTDRTGKATAFLRSLKDVDGVSAIGLVLKDNATITYAGNAEAEGPTATYTDDTATKWDESKWTNVIEAQVNFLKSASGAASGTGKVNVGSFNGKLVVYASGLNGKRISWKVGGRWGSAVASSNYAIFNRPTPRAGVTVNVEVFVDGVSTLTKSVVTR